MSDFEYGVLFVEFLNTSNIVFANYMTLIFAVLTASWFLAARMTRMVAVCFLALFTVAALAIGSGVYFAFSDFFALQSHMARTIPDHESLSWLGPLRVGGAPPFVAMQFFMAVIVLLSYAGAMAFFFIVRRSRLQTPDPGAS